MSVCVAYGAAPNKSAGKVARVAALIDVDGKILKYYDPAGKGEFPAEVLAELPEVDERPFYRGS